MKQCSICGYEKPLSEFKMRVRPPIQPYASCKSCSIVAYGRKGSYASEMKQLRERAKLMKNKNLERDAKIRKMRNDGSSCSVIAAEFNLSTKRIRQIVKS